MIGPFTLRGYMTQCRFAMFVVELAFLRLRVLVPFPLLPLAIRTKHLATFMMCMPQARLASTACGVVKVFRLRCKYPLASRLLPIVALVDYPLLIAPAHDPDPKLKSQ